jgi:hypothetical protein
MLRSDVSARIGVRGVARVVAGLGVCAAMLVAATSAPADGTTGRTTCTGPISNTEVTSNLTVPPGAKCELENVVVEGNVSVGQGANLLASATIERNLSADGADSVTLLAAEVDGNASFDATRGTSSLPFCPGVSVCVLATSFSGGNVSVTDTSPAGAVFAANFVAGHLSCTGNASVTNMVLGVEAPNTVLGRELGQCVGL